MAGSSLNAVLPNRDDYLLSWQQLPLDACISNGTDWVGVMGLWGMKRLSVAFLCMQSSTHIFPNPCQLFPLPRCVALHTVAVNWFSHPLHLPVSAQVSDHGMALLSAAISLSQCIYFSCWKRIAENSSGSPNPFRTLLSTCPHFDVKR